MRIGCRGRIRSASTCSSKAHNPAMVTPTANGLVVGTPQTNAQGAKRVRLDQADSERFLFHKRIRVAS